MPTAERMTVDLTPEMAGNVRRAVAAGEYISTDEAIRDALREWQERRDLLGYTVEELRKRATDGIDSGPSPFGSVAEVKAEARRRWSSVER